jgi:hypothetical protein
MKIKIALLITFSLGFYISSLNAQSAEWKVTSVILDLNDKPIENAKVVISYPTPRGPQVFSGSTGLSDKDGRVTLSERNPSYDGLIGFWVTRDGYYSINPYPYRFQTNRRGRWQPWNPEVTMVMRDIRNPIRMLWKKQRGFMPDGEKAVGYDFEVGDWVAPHGKGRTVDVIFSSESWAKTTSHYDGTLTISFPNEGDGIQEFRVDLPYHPTLLSDYDAPEEGYESKFLHRNASLPDAQGFLDETFGGHDLAQHFYLRTRTVLDAAGNVVSAHYTKWKGGIKYRPTTAHKHIYKNHRFPPQSDDGPQLEFTYFFNPTANDRNMEHDRTNANVPLPGSVSSSAYGPFGANAK